jgi:hypothetical protein
MVSPYENDITQIIIFRFSKLLKRLWKISQKKKKDSKKIIPNIAWNEYILFQHKYIVNPLIKQTWMTVEWSWRVNPSIHLLKTLRSSSLVIYSSPTFPRSWTFSTLTFMFSYIVCNMVKDNNLIQVRVIDSTFCIEVIPQKIHE